MEPGDPRIRELVASVSNAVTARLAAVTADIQDRIESSIPGLQADEFAASLQASVGENVAAILRLLADAADSETITAPAAAVDYARRLAQQDVPVTALIRAYRVGQARFLHHCIEELLVQSPGDHLEGLATLKMVRNASDYVDLVVEEVLTAYAAARDAWLKDRSAVLAMRIRDVLRGERIDVEATERGLDYRLDRHHVGMVLWSAVPDPAETLPRIRRLVAALAESLGIEAPPLVVTADETSAWAWVPVERSLAQSDELALAAKSEPAVALALGEPAAGLDGFRRSHRQAVNARAVALAAGDQRAQVTPFLDVAPIAMMCADLDSARAWVHETLGELAVDSARNDGLRETARAYLEGGGSYMAAAEQLFLHRNTAQYRVRKAEEVRGRPLREGRLDVELALLACHWLKGAVLQPAR